MGDKYLELLEQYDLNIYSSFRSRGTFQCDTDQGFVLMKEYHNSLKKLTLSYEWKNLLLESGFSAIDQTIPTKEGELLSYDRYHTPFLLKHYYVGRECDCKNRGDVQLACEQLARLHNITTSVETSLFDNMAVEDTLHLFMRKNRELRKIRQFIRNVTNKNSFELKYLHLFQPFYEKAEMTYQTVREKGNFEQLPIGVCHGAYHQHNILIEKNAQVSIINFLDITYAPLIMDLYLFLRKTMEKCRYSYDYFACGIGAYEKNRKLLEIEKTYLYYLFLYPEKFWKISNQYYNHRKSWLSPKLEEKLEKLLKMEPYRQKFLSILKSQL